MNSTARNIIDKAVIKFPEFKEAFYNARKRSEATVIFGSYACGCENEHSDIDILFVGDGHRKSSTIFDFTWVRPDRLYSRNWLGSELANHIARYGVWVEGDNGWIDKVYVSDISITKKKEKIYNRLIQLFLKKDRLSFDQKVDLLQKVIVNCHRLGNMVSKEPNPPTYNIVKKIKSGDLYLLDSLFSENMLGDVGGAMFKGIFQNRDIDDVLDKVNCILINRYI